jgi:hypothetical protein
MGMRVEGEGKERREARRGEEEGGLVRYQLVR